MQPHPEHQEDHAKFGQFRPERLVGHEAGRMGTHQHTGQQIAHQWRHAEPIGYHPEDKRQHQTRDDR